MENGENILKKKNSYNKHNSEIITIKMCILTTFLYFLPIYKFYENEICIFIIASLFFILQSLMHILLSMFVLSYKHDS